MNVKGEEIICRARLLFTLADLRAKAALTNMTQYNGKFGCPTCKQEGEQVSIGRGTTRAYGYQPSPLRSHQKHLQYANKAELVKKVRVIYCAKAIVQIVYSTACIWSERKECLVVNS